MIYLDHASSTRVKPIALSAIEEAPYANPNSIHFSGFEAAKLLKESDSLVKDYINGHHGRLVWLSTASLANYFVISTNINKDMHSFICMETAHKSISDHPSSHISLKPKRSGTFSFETLTKILTGRTRLISMLHVNNETGITHPIDLLKYEIRNSLYHVDAVQSLGKLSIDLRHINCDYFTMSGHKFGTPKGIACLWVKDNVPLNIPYLGTPPIPLISAFAKTLVSIDPKRNYRELLKKEIYLTETLQNYASLNNIEFDYNVFSGDRIPGILSIKFKGIDSSELLLTLIDKKIAISTGSACNSDEIAPSHVLIAMNISLKDVMSTVRISLSAESKYDEIKKGINILINTIREMKNERSELTKNY